MEQKPTSKKNSNDLYYILHRAGHGCLNEVLSVAAALVTVQNQKWPSFQVFSLINI